MENTNGNTNASATKAKIPPPRTLRHWVELTARNCHGECCHAIALWCEQNCEDAEGREMFRMFKQCFASMVRLNYAIGHFPYGSERCTLIDAMETEIVNRFGKPTLDAIRTAD